LNAIVVVVGGDPLGFVVDDLLGFVLCIGVWNTAILKSLDV